MSTLAGKTLFITGASRGIGAAIAFILFLIIIVFTLFQRWVLRDRPVSRRRIRAYQPKGVRS